MIFYAHFITSLFSLEEDSLKVEHSLMPMSCFIRYVVNWMNELAVHVPQMFMNFKLILFSHINTMCEHFQIRKKKP